MLDGNGLIAKLSSQSLLDEAKRLQALDYSALFFVKDGDTAAALGTAGESAGGGIHHQHQHPRAVELMNATAEELKGPHWISILSI